MINPNATILLLLLSNFSIIYFFSKKNSTFLVKIFSAEIFFLYLAPILFYFFTKNVYSSYQLLSIEEALLYLFIYNFLLISSYYLTSSFVKLPKFITAKYLSDPNSKNIKYLTILFILISIISDIYLYSIGKIKGAHPLLTNYTDIAYNLTTAKIAAVILLAKFIESCTDKKKYTIFYIIIWLLSGITLFFNFQKYNFFLLFMLFIYLHSEILLRRIKIFTILLITFSIFFLFFIPIFDAYKYNNLKIIEAINLSLNLQNSSIHISKTIFDIFFDFAAIPLTNLKELFMDRLNYIGLLSRAIELNFNTYTFTYASYFDNITGLIPRLFWEDKPLIGINGNIIGHDLNVLNPRDNSTSIALNSIGESYYLLGNLGIIVAIIQGLLMAILDKLNKVSNFIFTIIYFFVSLEIILISTYTIIIPKIIKIFFTYIVLYLILYEISKYKKFIRFNFLKKN